MKKIFAVLLLTLAISFSAKSQYLFNFGIDAYKTDNRDPLKFVDKAQFSFEANYFVLTQLAFTSGVEIWTNQGARFIPGLRFYPLNPFFLRFRPMIGKEVDYSFGIGYARKLTDLWRLEVMTDYYFERSNAALRVGVAYTL